MDTVAALQPVSTIRICTKERLPVKQQPYRIPHVYRDAVDKEIAERTDN